MNKFLALFFVFAVTCFSACREDDVTPEQNKCNKIIQNLATYKKKALDLQGHVAETGNITGYYEGDELKLAIAISNGENGRKKESYFFHSNHLIAMQQDEFIYNKPRYITKQVAATTGDSTWYDETKTVMKTSWFYFYNGHMVKWLNQQNQAVPDNSPNWEVMNDKLLLDADKLKQMLLN